MVISKLPLNPARLSFLSTILMIPAVPAASYLADGLVTTSICDIRLDGIDLSPPLPPMPMRPEGLPSIRIRTFSLPRRLTLPSTSTVTDGMLSSISCAVPPLLARSFPTVNIFLSNAKVVSLRSAVISISSRFTPSGDNEIIFISITLDPLGIGTSVNTVVL